MIFSRKAPLGALVLLALATPAFTVSAHAQDGEPANWTGPYIGGSLGYGWRKNNSDEAIRFDTNRDGNFNDTVRRPPPASDNAFQPGFCGGAANGNTPAAGCLDDKDGTIWQVHAGYDLQFGNIVAGAVIEGGRTNIDDSVSAFSLTPASYTMTRSLDWNGALRARLGYTTNGGTLFYGTGGVAYGKIKSSFSSTNVSNVRTETGRSEKSWGWVAGGGIDQKIGEHFAVGILYRYTRFNAEDYRVNLSGGTPGNAFVITPAGSTDFAREKRFDNHSVAATASYRF